MNTTIGHVIDPTRNYDLEASLRLQRLLVPRSLEPKWRFRGHWVTTGPYETMMGKPSCGSGGSQYSGVAMELPFSLGAEAMTGRVNHWILRALCDYPGFAELSEVVRDLPFGNCGQAAVRLAGFNGRQTARRLNQFHARARVVQYVRLVCGPGGVEFEASISFNPNASESHWGVYWLLRRPRPRWTGRGRLAKWLGRCADELEGIIEEEGHGKETDNRKYRTD